MPSRGDALCTHVPMTKPAKVIGDPVHQHSVYNVYPEADEWVRRLVTQPAGMVDGAKSSLPGCRGTRPIYSGRQFRFAGQQRPRTACLLSMLAWHPLKTCKPSRCGRRYPPSVSTNLLRSAEA